MKKAVIFLLLLVIAGCSKHHSSDDVIQNLQPGKATLQQPLQNAICTSGTIISDSRSGIAFNWTAGANNNSYQLVITNLLTHTDSTVNTSFTQITVPLTRNTPYSWHIVSQTSGTTTTAQSDTWKFYNPGPGIATNAPYPAELLTPTYGQQLSSGTTAVNLTWQNSTASSGLSYDVYFGTTSTPALFKAGLSATQINVAVQSGKSYFWQIVCKDNNGNGSYSGVSQFSLP